jgi:4-amino-4-deoxy-L-arabinose transferase-like glycosyltransferase
MLEAANTIVHRLAPLAECARRLESSKRLSGAIPTSHNEETMNRSTTAALDKRTPWIWIAIIILAAVVYTVGISHESFWYDEAYSSVIASYLPWQIPAQVMVDNHPPLYYILLSLVRMVLGSSEWALRSLSVAGAVGMVALGAGPVRRILGNRNAFLYAIVVLFTPAILIYAHEARMYSLAICAVTAGALYGYLAVMENRARDWALFGAATLAGAYLHYYGLIAAFFLQAFVCFWLLIKRRGQLKTYLIVGAVVVVAYLPWLIVFIRQTIGAHKAFWLGPLSWDGIRVAFIQPFGYREQFPARTFAQFLSDVQLTQYLAFALAAVLCISGLVIAWRKGAEREAGFGRFVLLAYLGVVITTMLVSLFLMPLFFSRYLLVVSGLFLLLVSLGMGMLPGKYLPWIAAGLFAILNVFTIKDIYTRNFNHPMRQLAEKLDGAVQPNDLIITSDSYSLGPAFYYWPQAVHYYQNNPIEARWGDVLNPFVPPLHYEKDLPELLATHKTFWYITCNTGASMQIDIVLRGAPGWFPVGLPVRVIEPYSSIIFKAQKYEYKG